MMDGLSLYQQRDKAIEELLEETKRYRDAGLTYSQNEYEYRKSLSVLILNLRADGMPVTIIQDVARGLEPVAGLRYARDCSQAIRDSSLQFIQSLKQDIRIKEADIQRELGVINYVD